MKLSACAVFIGGLLVSFALSGPLLADQAGYEAWRQQRDPAASVLAATHGEPYAMIDLGHCYINGDEGCVPQYGTAIELWRGAVMKGEAWMLDELILALAEGAPEERMSDPDTPRWVPMCHLAGYVRDNGLESHLQGVAKSYVALCFLSGRKVDQDATYGINLLLSAAREHHLTDAARILADIYEKGHYGLPINYEVRNGYRRLAAANRHMAAQQ